MMGQRVEIDIKQERLDEIEKQLHKSSHHQYYDLANGLFLYINKDYNNREERTKQLFDQLDEAYGCSIKKIKDAETLLDGALHEACSLLFGAARTEDLFDLLRRRLEYTYSGQYSYRKGYRSQNCSYYLDGILELVSCYYFYQAYDFTVLEYLTSPDKQLSDDYIMSYLIAREIDNGNKAVVEALSDVLFGENQTALLSRNMIRGIVRSHSVECYQMLGKLLLAARLQEGLRQHIVESLDEGTLEAAIYLVKFIIDNKLERFSAVIRALDTWTGLGFSDQKPAVIRKCLELALRSLTDPSYAAEAEQSSDALVYYFMLWGAAYREIEETKELIERTLQSGARYKKLAALYFLSHSDLGKVQHEVAARHLPAAADDMELLAWLLRNYHYEYSSISTYSWERRKMEPNGPTSPLDPDFDKRKEQFDVLLQLFQQLKGSTKVFNESVFPWGAIQLDPDEVMGRLLTIVSYDFNSSMIDRLIDSYDHMGTQNRLAFIVYYIRRLQSEKQRAFLLTALGDKSSSNREAILKIMGELELTAPEQDRVTALLKQKSGAVRQGAIELLIKQNDEPLSAALTELLAASSVQQRLAGLELVNQLQHSDGRQALYSAMLQKVEQLHAAGRATAQEQVLIDKLLNTVQPQYSASNGFGLYDPDAAIHIPDEYHHPALQKADSMPLPLTPQIEGVLYINSERLKQIAAHFAAIFEGNKDYEYETEYYDGRIEKVLLGNQYYSLSKMYNGQEKGNDAKDRLDHYPLPELWRQAARDLKLTASDMLQLLSATIGTREEFNHREAWSKEIYSDVIEHMYDGIWDLPYFKFIVQLIRLLLAEQNQQEVFRLCMDTYKHLRSRMTVEQCSLNSYAYNEDYYYRDRHEPPLESWLITFWLNEANSVIENDEQFTEWFYTAYSSYQLTEKKYGSLLQLDLFARALQLGLLTEQQMLKEMMTGLFADDLIRLLTHPKWSKTALTYSPRLADLTKQAVDRMVEIEALRGDMPTEVSSLVRFIYRFEGMRHFTSLLTGLGKETFQRGYSYGSRETKKEILSSLLQSCYPAEPEDAALLGKLLTDTDISEQRLLEAAMYAPQWVNIVQQYLGWPGLKSAAWYFHAHINATFSAQKETEVAIFSPISPQSFNDGAFDSAWFKSAYAEIGDERFQMLYICAKYISDGGSSHRRAQLFADATLGRLDKEQLAEEIAKSRNKDKLLSFTLIPVKENDKQDALERYEFIQRFLKESKQFGAQRRESEGVASAIALENLARNLGYSDVNRMMWTLEADKFEEIKKYFSPQTINGVELWLAIEEEGEVTIHVEKAGKALKSIPSAITKHEQVLQLKELQKSLKDQYARARKSLEQAMEHQTVFTLEELINITRNPIVAPLVQSLVWVLPAERQLGYLHQASGEYSHQANGGYSHQANGGNLRQASGEFSLRQPDGTLKELAAEAVLYLAHPVDLYESGLWSDFQKDLFERQIKQPFKQVFREYYRMDVDEAAAGTVSRRYAGHQVQPQRTVALLRGRTWTVDYEEGLQKVYYKENLIARMYAMADWFSPSDIEPPTLETVQFFDRATFKPVRLDQVPAIIFSEVMRDIDLVVSVAHAGGVDPEASHSTVEMRAAIARELLMLLDVGNVRIEGSHAHITGTLGEYSVHMGSGVVHKKGTGALNIVPVHSQSRGRLFLPFVDSDPRTAEIMSKLLLLAEDNKIKDPSILAKL
ncbi:DUF4132 domain-containing protein [Paenibacillus sp. IITD108]|uniref:DUF4132 domain-containing protein n=1 Tax=Paenibacillus sp. IITD108 TaxID=3116649 RepID=UPI002F3EC5CF